MGSVIAKGKFETPRNGASKSSTKATGTKAKSSTKAASKTKSKAAGSTSAAKPQTVAAGKAAGKKSRKTGLIVVLILALLICAGAAAWLLLSEGLSFGSTESGVQEVEPIEEMENLTDYTAIYPNVYIGELLVGELSTEEALELLEAYIADNMAQTLWVTLSNDVVLTFEITGEYSETAIRNLVTEAWNYGRDGSAQEQAAALEESQNGATYTVELNLDLEPDTAAIRSQVNAYVDDLACTVVQTKVGNSVVELGEESWALEITKGTQGVAMDADALYLAVLQAVTAGDVSPIDFTVTVTEPDALDYEAIAEAWNQEAENAYYDAETQSVVEGSQGYLLDVAVLEALLEEAEMGETVQVPIVVVLPELDRETLESLLFADTLSTKSTYYTSNANRTTNLRLACEAINGTVIQPGEEFSFNAVVGERTSDKGYQAATVFATGGTSEQELGGGICQVASTIYYCALYANLEIVERWEHMYTVDYIESGLDAAIYWGSQDLVFRNNTDYPIQIVASVTGTVNIELLGTKTDGTYVEMEVVSNGSTAYEEETIVDETKPVGYSEVTQTGYTGRSFTSYRCVYDEDGNLISRTKEADSVHKVRNRIITVGPDEETEEEEELEEEEAVEVPAEEAEPSTEDSTQASDTTQNTTTQQPTGSTDSGTGVMITE